MISELRADIGAIAAGGLPGDVRTIAKCCILDWIGVTIAGTHEPLVEMLLPEILTAADAPCSLIGRAERTSAQSAALVNGTAGDALDFSDCNRTLNGHATATVLPAALAVAERTGATGEALLRAFVAGVETACRVGRIVGTGVLDTPFHPTAVAGPFGAAAAAAVLLRLEAAQFDAALGIAATQAAGLASAVGTMCKPLHAGTAAAAGVLAAGLAARGFTAPDALEPGGGFLRAHTSAADANALETSRGRFLIEHTLMKEHAACALVHGSIDNMRALKRNHALDPNDVRSIRLGIATSSARVCDIVAPASGLEVKFSVRTVAAMALLGYDTGDLASYSDGIAQNPAVVALRERIAVDASDDLDVAVSKATIELRDGRIVEARTDERTIDRDLDRRRERTRRKFAALTAPYVTPVQAAALENRIFDLEGMPRADVRP